MPTSISQEVVNELASTVPSELARPGDPVYLGQGFDVAVYRWGEHTLRFPIRRDAVELIENEYRWLPDATGLVSEAGFAVPTPRYRGISSNIFDFPWIIVDYVEGDPLHTIPVSGRGRAARDLAAALAVLHRPSPPEAPINPFRGVELASRAATFDGLLETGPGRNHLRARFEAGCAADPWQGPPVWCHGDPHPANVIVSGDRLSGLIDFGDLGQGDPAVDYAAFHLGFTAEQRADARVILRSMGAADDDALWQRAEGWASFITASLLAAGDPALRALGEDAASLLSAS